MSVRCSYVVTRTLITKCCHQNPFWTEDVFHISIIRAITLLQMALLLLVSLAPHHRLMGHTNLSGLIN